MPRDEILFADQLIATGEGAPNLEGKMQLLQAMRLQSAEVSQKVDAYLLRYIEQSGRAMREAKGSLAGLKDVLDRLSATPWHPALYLQAVGSADAPRAMVLHGHERRIVSLTDGVDPDSLEPGDEVFLSYELNTIMGKNPDGGPRFGETALFDRRIGDLLVLKARDEEVIVGVARPLRGASLKAGDQVRWNRNAWMAFEKIERSASSSFVLDEAPDVRADQVGGQETNLEKLLNTLTAVLVAPQRAAQYGVAGKQSILLIGPPGCGKTLMARVAAAEVARLSGKKCRFFVVKPGEWESCWVGATELKIRELFASLREAAAEGLATLFLDEVESVGRARGGAARQHDDKALAALLAELDGFTGREGVAIISATNRKDMIDAALLERLSDVEIQVRRPDMRGARTIFGIHLPPSLPYCPNGDQAKRTREEIIDTAVARFYSPNSEYNELTQIRFRDGKTRVVAVRELASGRLFTQVCRAARQEAFLRDVRSGGEGLRTGDMDTAVAAAVERLATTLTVRNVREYLPDLSSDHDVVSVEPIAKKVRQASHYVGRGAA